MTLKSWQMTNITPFYRWKNWNAKKLTMQEHRAGAELGHNFGHLTSRVYYAYLITNLHDKPSFYIYYNIIAEKKSSFSINWPFLPKIKSYFCRTELKLNILITTWASQNFVIYTVFFRGTVWIRKSIVIWKTLKILWQ